MARFAGAGDCEIGQSRRATGVPHLDRHVRGAGADWLFRRRRPCSISSTRRPKSRRWRCRSSASTSRSASACCCSSCCRPALRAAGDSRTPLRLGLAMTLLNVILNIILIRGFGPIPRAGDGGLGAGHRDRVHRRQHARPSTICSAVDFVIRLLAAHGVAARLDDHQIAVPLRPADGRPRHRDERRRRAAAAVHRFAASRAPPRRRPMPSATPSCFR